MNKILKDMLEKRQNELKTLEERNAKASTVEELRQIGKEIDDCKEEIRSLEAAIADAEKAEREAEQRGKNPFPNGKENRDAAEKHLEYRKAFKEFVQRGTPIPAELREAGPTLGSEVSALIPTEIMNEVLQSGPMAGYGQIYDRVRKLGIPFGVKFPISQLEATFSWVDEDAEITPQKAGDANTYVTFSANIGSVSFSQSILVTIEALDVFEREMARLLRKAFLKAMDTAIINGTGTNSPKGILQDSRVDTDANFSAADNDIDNWTKWNSLLWSKVPEDKQDGTLIVGRSTYYNHLLNMQDTAGHPLCHEKISEMNEKGIERSFMGREVLLVPDALLNSYDTASTSAVVAIWGVLSDYGLNELQGFGLRQWEKHESHQTVTEGLVVCDGHVLESYGFIKIKKVA